MTHFAYPNVENLFHTLEEKDKTVFIGCGRFTAISSAEKEIIYRTLLKKQSLIQGIEKIEFAYKTFVHHPVNQDMEIYERTHPQNDFVDHDSFAFAYFLALVNCSKSLKPDIRDDIWCMGRITVSTEKKPCLDVKYDIEQTDQAEFEIALTAFINDDFSSLFIVPEKNITSKIEAICKNHKTGNGKRTKILSVDDFRSGFSGETKTVLKVRTDELKALIHILFESGPFYALTEKFLSRIPEKISTFLLSKSVIPWTGRNMSYAAVTHFAYPNIMNDELRYCGFLTIFPSSCEDELKYSSENPDTNIRNILDCYKKLIKSPQIKTGSVFERKDQGGREYQGPSMGLAYLLSFVGCHRPLRIPVNNDIWCTGAVSGDGSCFVEKVDADEFNVKLEAFLENETDNLFIVPEKNINETNQNMISEGNADILTIKAFKKRYAGRKNKKTILKVRGDELEYLTETLFAETRDFRIIRLTLAALLVSLIVYFLSGTQLFQAAESGILNQMFRIRGIQKPSSKIKIISIDDTDIKLMGSWPWKRNNHLTLLEILNNPDCRVRTIGYNIIFSDSYDDKTDKLFSEYIKKASNVVIPMTFDDSGLNRVLPYESLRDIRGLGFVYKSESPGFDIKMKDYFFYGVEVLKNYLWCDNSDVNESEEKMTLVSPYGDKTVIPLYRGRKFYLNYYGPYNVWQDQTYPFHKILKAHRQSLNKEKTVIELDDFKNKIVIVSVTATALANIHKQPFGNDYGVYFIATFLSNALNNEFLIRISDLNNVFLLFTLNFTLGFILCKQPKYCITIFLGWLCVLTGSIYFLFSLKHLWINTVAHLVAMTLTAVLTNTYVRGKKS
ncbi:MAG: CHASE2 domain-containing protein [Desulfobacteraceae bacterium]|nr:CHASE2 domain-containing protein [Desulfobacteraceae bacterium]